MEVLDIAGEVEVKTRRSRRRKGGQQANTNKKIADTGTCTTKRQKINTDKTKQAPKPKSRCSCHKQKVSEKSQNEKPGTRKNESPIVPNARLCSVQLLNTL